jgi:DNA-binding transcriptional LysR family regulator
VCCPFHLPASPRLTSFSIAKASRYSRCSPAQNAPPSDQPPAQPLLRSFKIDRFSIRVGAVQVDGRLTANELPIAIAAAIGGLGLIQLPLAYVAPELAAGRLITVLADWARPPVDGFFLYYPSRRQLRSPLTGHRVGHC